MHLYLRIVLILSFVLCFCPPLYGAQNKAILIGISQYADPDMDCIAYADEDVRTFSSVLMDYAGYQPSEVTVLLNQEATKDRIVKAVNNAVKSSRKKPFDHFILMFAGHGLPGHIQSEKTNSFLAPHDAVTKDFFHEGELINNETFINKAWLTRQLSEIKSKSIIIVLDSCYSGAKNFGELFAKNFGLQVGSFSGTGETRSVVVVHKKNAYAFVDSRIVILASSREDQPSTEYRELKHGALSYCIFQYINTIRKETEVHLNRELTVSETYSNIRTLFETVRVRGTPLSAVHQPVLFPIPDYENIKTMKFVSIQGGKKPEIKKGILEIITDPQGAEIYVDGERTGQRANDTLELTTGKHTISLFLPETNYNHSFIVDIREGQQQQKVVPLRGNLEVTSFAAKAWQDVPLLDVYVDDRYVGKTGLRLANLVAGTHRLRVHAEGITKERHIEIRPSSPLEVKYKIVREAVPAKDSKPPIDVPF